MSRMRRHSLSGALAAGSLLATAAFGQTRYDAEFLAIMKTDQTLREINDNDLIYGNGLLRQHLEQHPH